MRAFYNILDFTLTGGREMLSENHNALAQGLAYVRCWGKTCGSLDEIPSATMRSCKSKTLNEF